jgi:hypothetical protein
MLFKFFFKDGLGYFGIINDGALPVCCCGLLSIIIKPASSTKRLIEK